MRIRPPHSAATTTLSLSLILLVAASATAATPRPAAPDALTLAHVVVHYDPGRPNSAPSDAQVTGSAVETAWDRIVVGGAGPNNMGFRRPPPDGTTGSGQDLLDVYLTPHPTEDNFDGGTVLVDENGQTYMVITPKDRGEGIRGLAAHEFFHAVQHAYTYGFGAFTEGTANWASGLVVQTTFGGDEEWMLGEERLPLDCSYDTWPASGGVECGNGYRQALFFTGVSGRRGTDVIRRAFELSEGLTPGTAGRVTSDDGMEGLQRALAERGSTLANELAAHAQAVNDPTRWPRPAELLNAYRYGGAPGEKVKEYVSGRPTYAPDPVGIIARGRAAVSGVQPLPHLAYRVIRMRRPARAARRGDRLRITVTPNQAPRPGARLVVLTGTKQYGKRKTVVLARVPGKRVRWAVTIQFGPAEATAGQPLVLVNDSYDRDGLRFSWTATILRPR